MSETHEDFVSFEKALRELQMRSEELKKLVSEGEIRAFRDGESMKFKREDIESLSALSGADEELVFADALEDDTGMATEELSEEDTLLAEVDLLEDEEPAARRGRAAATPRGARARAATETAATGEPAWVTVSAILCTVVLVWGFLAMMQIASEQPPSGALALFGN